MVAGWTDPRLFTAVFIMESFRSNNESVNLSTINFCRRLNVRDNKMKISIKFSWRKMIIGEKSGTKDYTNRSFCSCSKLLWAQCKKECVQIIDTQVFPSLLRRSWRYSFTQMLPCCLWVCFYLLASLNFFPC